MITLKVTGSGESIEVRREIVVGRADSDLTISDPELSRHHLAVRPADGGVEVEDLGSMNGTFVDGERLTGARILRKSARLSLGDTELQLELPPEATPPPTRITRRPQAAAAGPQPGAARWDDRAAAKAALIMALAGGILGSFGSAAHPQPSPDDTNTVAFLETIVPSDTWVLLHVLVLFATLIGCAALVLLARTLATGPGAILAWIAAVFIVVATAVATVWMVLDGVAMKAIADDWAVSKGAAHIADERAAVAIEHFILALFSSWLVLWLGIAYVFFGLAYMRDTRFPTWTGIGWTVIGAVSLILGLVQFGTERDALVTHILVPIVSVFGGLWLPLAIFMWWRRARVA